MLITAFSERLGLRRAIDCGLSLSYFALKLNAEKLVITFEPFLFHIQKNKPRTEGGVFISYPQDCNYQHRYRVGRVDHFISGDARVSGKS